MIRSVSINGDELAAIYRARAKRFPEAVLAGLRRIYVAVERSANALLSGGGAAWSYPVPRRSGDLARGMYGRIDAFTAEIGNKASYAWAVHTGKHPRWRSPPAVARPFLTDGAGKVDHVAIMESAVRGAW